MTNPPTNFLKYVGTPFEHFILPIIPKDAPLSADSKLTREQLGKIPGKRKPDGTWIGFHAWQGNWTTPSMLKRWQEEWQAETAIALAIRLREVLAVDIDINDAATADAVDAGVRAILGPPSAVRRREGSARRVLFYAHNVRTMPITKMRLAFHILAHREEKPSAVEILGAGQQVLMEGPHVSGAMHYWENGIGLIEAFDAQRVNQKTVHDFDNLMMQLKAYIDQNPGCFERVTPHLPTSGGERGEVISINDLTSPHLEKDLAKLRRAIEKIDINAAELTDYERWLALFRAMKAACQGDDTFYHEVILPKMLEHPDNVAKGEEWLEARWHSFDSSSIGADFVYQMAAHFGFKEEIHDAQGIFADQPLPEAVHNDAAGGDDNAGVDGAQGVAGNQPANVGGGPPGPLLPAHSDNAAADRCAATFSDERKYGSDQGWMKLKNGVWVPDKTIIQRIAEVCAAIGQPYRAQGGQGIQIDLVMNSTRKHEAVERRMRSHPSFYVDKDEFDTDPWLLNTPGGIFDIRDCTLRPHGDLMRMQTEVTPDVLASMRGWETSCPMWMAYLKFIDNDRPYVIPFLKRWGGQHFVGLVLGEFMLFIHGKPGTGKTVFVDIILRLGGESYIAPLSQTFLIRVPDKRSFELYQLFKKRGAIADETPKGSTWDEMRALQMLSNSKLSAEGKGKPFMQFRNTATITVTGNHKPNFVTHSEESGIERRLLVLTCDKKIADYMPADDQFAAKLIEQEGPAILMWFLEGAMEGYQSLQATGSYMGDLAKPLLVQAAAYRREANPFLQWIKEDMELDPTADIEAKDAFAMFNSYMRDQNPRHHMSKLEFREGLEKATDGRVTYKMRSRNPNKGRMVFDGSKISGNNSLTDVNGNPVMFSNNP